MREDIYAVLTQALLYHTAHEYLHGGCYALAKALANRFNGEILVNRQQEHCIVCVDGKCYDIRGVVKNTDGYHPFRNKEEKKVAKEFYIKSPEYTSYLIECLSK